MEEPIAEMMAERTARRKPGRRPQDEGSAEDTRHAILAHALHLFNTRGYTGVSIDDIVTAAGVSKPTFYYHFPGKAEALIESLLWLLGNVREMLERVLRQPGRTVYERLAHLLRERRTFLDREPVLVFNQTMMDEAMARLTWEQQKRFRQAMGGFHAPLRALMAEGIESGELAPADPDILAVAFRQLFGPSTYHALADHDPHAVDRAILDLFYRGAAVPNTEYPTTRKRVPDTHREG